MDPKAQLFRQQGAGRTSTIRTILVLIATMVGLAAGCSLHYDQQVDGQTLDLEVMRPVPVNRHRDLDKSRRQNSHVEIPVPVNRTAKESES